MISSVAHPGILLVLLLLVSPYGWCSPTQAPHAVTEVSSETAGPDLSIGKKIYREGVLPSGELLSGRILGDVSIKGNQVICDTCHRHSGMGATEGQEVVPAITGDLLYEPLRLPTSQPDLAPVLRPAYTDETLRRAIREGIGPDGQPLSGFMPRYELSDTDVDSLIGYLKSLSSSPASGVTDSEMHFATIVSDEVGASARKAMLDVLHKFFQRKNAGTRHETDRAAHAPWHKEWLFKPYRKWKLHVWELTGPQETWAEQLTQFYGQQPVFAVVSGMAAGDWRPVHEFCEHVQLPCLFPTTDMPVVDSPGFYTLYFSAGMALEARVIARHAIEFDGPPESVFNVYVMSDPRSASASGFLRRALQKEGVRFSDHLLDDSGPLDADVWKPILREAGGRHLVLWLGDQQLTGFWEALADSETVPERIYLSSTLYDIGAADIPEQWRKHVFAVHPYALPEDVPRLLARSSGWLKGNRIYAPDEQRVQANTFFALKVAGEAVKAIRGFFNREYLIERIEHMLDNATYTGVYPTVTLAPGQRFVSKGAFVGPVAAGGAGQLRSTSTWMVP